jgi:hypothetical protein
MEAIDEQQEKRIDNSKKYYGSIRYDKEDEVIVGSNIYLYGEVDLNNEEDLELIENFNLIDSTGGRIYSNFDYKDGKFTTIDGIAKQYTTWNPVLWFSYCHVLIGKPKRIPIKPVTKPPILLLFICVPPLVLV